MKPKTWKLVIIFRNGNALTYTIDDYLIEDGLLFFVDKKTNKQRAFPVELCQLCEV